MGRNSIGALFIVLCALCYFTTREKAPRLKTWHRVEAEVIQVISLSEKNSEKFYEVELDPIYRFTLPGEDEPRTIHVLWNPGKAPTVGTQQTLLVNPDDLTEAEVFWWAKAAFEWPRYATLVIGIWFAFSWYREFRWRENVQHSSRKPRGF